ncbi:MAG: ABC transporter substrate-binding protein [Marinosulfonomonas sp.]|nr:ABC transporter substrate-binding protein [Marinosulfonomonas sp.]
MLKIQKFIAAGAVALTAMTTGQIAVAQDNLIDLPIAGTLPVSGPISDIYLGLVRASMMALEDNADKLAAAGWRIPANGEYHVEDTLQKVDRGIPTMQLQLGRGAQIIHSLITPIVIAQAQLATRSNALIFGSYMQGPSLDGLDNLLVGMTLADVEAKPLGNFAATVLEAKTAAIIFVDDEYGSLTAESFEKAYTDGGGEVTLKLPIPANPTDFRNESVRISITDPDIVFIIHRGGYSLAIETLRDAGYDGLLLSGSAALVAGRLTPVAAEGEGMILSTVTGSPEARKTFRERYEARWNTDLPAESALIPYAGTEVLIAALANVPATNELDVEDIEKAWMSLGTVDTLVGTAVISGRSVVYPINLEKVEPNGDLVVIGSCDETSCTAQN